MKLGIRFIQMSTDCVFSGRAGLYRENDEPDATDLYGRLKLLGEISELENALTIRTSIIGHGMKPNDSLVDWFLAQKGECYGYKNAIFSGFPTKVLSNIFLEFILPNYALNGVYHIASNPISKFDLLKKIRGAYKKEIEILPDDKINIDRSLNADRFNKVTNYVPPSWDEMIGLMHEKKRR
jgi:dTDP-4-dehydrorhamnose reductase